MALPLSLPLDRARSPWAAIALDAALLPARVAVAATQTTLQLGRLAAPDGPVRRPGGYADQLWEVIGEGGYAEQLMALLTDDEGPMRLAEVATEMLSPDRPLGRMLQRGGVVDRLLADDGPVARLTAEGGGLDRLLQRDGAVDRLVAPGGALDRLLEPDGALDKLIAHEGVLDRLLQTDGPVDRLTRPGGLLDTVLAPGGLADRLLADDAFLEKVLADGGTLDQLVELGATLEAISPRLEEIARLVPALSEAADALGRSVGPIGDLAGRLPLTRRRAVGSGA